MDAADLDHGPPPAALLRLVDAGWWTLERYPLLLRRSDESPHAANAGTSAALAVREGIEAWRGDTSAAPSAPCSQTMALHTL